MATWLVDGNNVMGATVRGWWNDRPAAAARLTAAIARWCLEHPDDQAVVVFDGPSREEVTRLAGGNLRVEYAGSSTRDAADDRIVELVDELYVDPALVVVTSDRGLVARLPPGLEVRGAGTYGRRLGRI